MLKGNFIFEEIPILKFDFRSIFDEPFLLKPVNRKQPFSLQTLCIAQIASRCTPKTVETLPIPQPIKQHILTTFAAV